MSLQENSRVIEGRRRWLMVGGSCEMGLRGWNGYSEGKFGESKGPLFPLQEII